MKIGKIKHSVLKNEAGDFVCMAIESKFVGKANVPCSIKFEYAKFTTNLNGILSKVIASVEQGKSVPKHVTSLELDWNFNEKA